LKPLEGFPEYDIGWDQLDFTGVEVRDPSRDLFTPGRRNLPLDPIHPLHHRGWPEVTARVPPAPPQEVRARPQISRPILVALVTPDRLVLA
jgi:hypothetical protein